MSTVIKPPFSISESLVDKPSVFLAGSIEMGVAEDWQTRLTTALNDLDVVIFNPRRDSWDSSWEQSIERSEFREQVEWELLHLNDASVIALYFDPTTKSPISLLELGLFARTGKVIVMCPDGFWRKGNVDVVCNWFAVHQVNSFDELIEEVRNELTGN